MSKIVSMGSTRLTALRDVYKNNLTTAVLLDTNGNVVSSSEAVSWSNLNGGNYFTSTAPFHIGGVTLASDIIFEITAGTYPVTVNRVRYGTGSDTLTVPLTTSEEFTEPNGRYILTGSEIFHPWV